MGDCVKLILLVSFLTVSAFGGQLKCPDEFSLEGFRESGFIALHDVVRTQRMTNHVGDFFREAWDFRGDRGPAPSAIYSVHDVDVKFAAMAVSRPALVRLWGACRALGPNVDLTNYNAVVRLLQKNGAAFHMPFANRETGGITFLVELARARHLYIRADEFFKDLWLEVGLTGRPPEAIESVHSRDLMWANERGLGHYAQAFLRLNSASWALFYAWCEKNDRRPMSFYEIQELENFRSAFRRMGITK